jgi:hypothetical protein
MTAVDVGWMVMMIWMWMDVEGFMMEGDYC